MMELTQAVDLDDTDTRDFVKARAEAVSLQEQYDRELRLRIGMPTVIHSEGMVKLVVGGRGKDESYGRNHEIDRCISLLTGKSL